MPFEPRDEGDDTFTESDWLEAIQESAPADTFSLENSEAVIPVYIKNATEGKLRSAITFCLGYSFADEGDPYQLHRVSPVAHPKYGFQMRAQAVQFTPINPVGNPDNLDNKPFKTSLIMGEGEGGISRYARYGQCWMTVRFGPRKDLLFEDDDETWSGNEWDRYVEKSEESSLDVLMSDSGGVLYWAETCPGGPSLNPPSSFPGQIGELVHKSSIQLLWKNVPLGYHRNADDIPVKLRACTGCVNSEPFMGYDPGTLLFQPPKYQRRQFPFYSEDGRALYEDILIMLSHFDPTPGADPGPPKARGHNLMPWKGGATDGSGPSWLTCYRRNSTSGIKYLKEIDFATAFDHHAKP